LLCPLAIIHHLSPALVFIGVAGASWAPYTPIETSLLQRLVPADIRGQVFGARYALLVAASPVGAALGGVLLTYMSAGLVILISGIACILAGLGGIVAPSLRALAQPEP
jgi:MFS family permease